MEHDFDERIEFGIFTTEKKAEDFIDQMNKAGVYADTIIEELPIDPTIQPGNTPWRVMFQRNKKNSWVLIDAKTEDKFHVVDCMMNQVDGRNHGLARDDTFASVFCFAFNEAEAFKMAQEIFEKKHTKEVLIK